MDASFTVSEDARRSVDASFTVSENAQRSVDASFTVSENARRSMGAPFTVSEDARRSVDAPFTVSEKRAAVRGAGGTSKRRISCRPSPAGKSVELSRHGHRPEGPRGLSAQKIIRW